MPLEDPQIITREAVPTAVVRAENLPMADLPTFYDGAYGTVSEALAAQGARPTGAAFGLYLVPPSETFTLEAGFPVSAPITSEGEVHASQLPAGEVVRATHAGGYDGLPDSWGALMAWVGEQGRTPGLLWEVYVTDPSPEMDPATLRTDLFVQLTD